MPFDPGALVLIVALGVLYARAVAVLTRRGLAVARRQQALWWVGLAAFAVALLGPLDALSDDLLTAHMGQHLLIADLGAPLLVAGLRWPVLVHLLPPAALAPLARRRGLRRLLAPLRTPLGALAAYVLLLYAWHFAALFEGAMASEPVHVLQHQSFVAGSLLIWWVALEPGRRHITGGLWKIGLVLGARLMGMMIGMAFVLIREPVYGSYDGAHGLDALADQQLAGALMLTVDFVVMLFSLAFFFWRAGQEADRGAEPLARV